MSLQDPLGVVGPIEGLLRKIIGVLTVLLGIKPLGCCSGRGAIGCLSKGAQLLLYNHLLLQNVAELLRLKRGAPLKGALKNLCRLPCHLENVLLRASLNSTLVGSNTGTLQGKGALLKVIVHTRRIAAACTAGSPPRTMPCSLHQGVAGSSCAL